MYSEMSAFFSVLFHNDMQLLLSLFSYSVLCFYWVQFWLLFVFKGAKETSFNQLPLPTIPRDIKILGCCPAWPVLPYGEKVPV